MNPLDPHPEDMTPEEARASGWKCKKRVHLWALPFWKVGCLLVRLTLRYGCSRTWYKES